MENITAKFAIIKGNDTKTITLLDDAPDGVSPFYEDSLVDVMLTFEGSAVIIKAKRVWYEYDSFKTWYKLGVTKEQVLEEYHESKIREGYMNFWERIRRIKRFYIPSGWRRKKAMLVYGLTTTTWSLNDLRKSAISELRKELTKTIEPKITEA